MKRKRSPFRIFATDLSLEALGRAPKGLFNRSALGNIRLRHLSEYFSGNGETFTLGGRIKEKVHFSCYDLLDSRTICPPACIYGDFDLIGPYQKSGFALAGFQSDSSAS